MKEVLKGRDPQVIRHLLQHAAESPATPHIAYEQLFTSLMGNIRAFYTEDSDKTCLEKNFFVFHSFAKGVLDLLQENTEVDSVSVDHELRLLDAAYYLTYNGMLGELSVGQTREDYTAGMLLERCLLVHGVKSYPHDFKKLVGLQDALGEKKHAAALTYL